MSSIRDVMASILIEFDNDGGIASRILTRRKEMVSDDGKLEGVPQLYAVAMDEAKLEEILGASTAGLTAQIATLQEQLAAAEAGEPAPSGPVTQVSMAQARVALSRAGLLTAVQAAIDQAGGEAKIAWEYSTVVSRNSTLVAQLASALELTDEMVDGLFSEAAATVF